MAKRRPAEVLASRTILAMPSGAWSRPRQGSDFPRLVSASEQNIALEGRNIVPGDWKKDGSIGTSHPPTKKKAIKQAVAIALAKAGKSRNTKPRKRSAG